MRACNNMATVLVRVLRKNCMYQEMVHRMERWKGKRRMTKTLNVYLGKKGLENYFLVFCSAEVVQEQNVKLWTQ